MPRLEPTTVMTLGRIYAGNLEPPLRTSFLNPPPTTPGYPQNLLRQAVMNGLQGIRGVGLGIGMPAMPESYPGPMEQAQYEAGEATAAAANEAAQTSDRPLVPDGGAAAAPNGSRMMWRPSPLWYGLATVSSVASLYHGYKRNESKGSGKALGWGLWWFLMGSMFPIVTPAVALSMGYAKPKRR